MGFDVQIRPRSGLSAQGVMATLGTIDADYRGELLVTMFVLPIAAAPRPQRRPHRAARDQPNGRGDPGTGRGTEHNRTRRRRPWIHRPLTHRQR
jgi:hypothetical protein